MSDKTSPRRIAGKMATAVAHDARNHGVAAPGITFTPQLAKSVMKTIGAKMTTQPA